MMRLEKITVNYSAEKLQAIKVLAPEIYGGIEKTLKEQLEKIYTKAVPLSTRKYIEAKLKEESAVPPKGGNKNLS